MGLSFPVKNTLLAAILALFLMSFQAFATDPSGDYGHVSMIIPAVEKSGSGQVGSMATLDIFIKPGNGHVFVDTVPLTELDTQVGGRIAKEAVEETLGMSLEKYDIFYVIRSDAPVISGPSGGAAMATGLMAIVLNLSVDRRVIMTGTCSPDGSVGRVGGIIEKSGAVASAGGRVFLIPKGQAVVIMENSTVIENSTIIISQSEKKVVDAVEYGKSLNITIVEVSDISEALAYMTGYSIQKENISIESSPELSESMRKMSESFIHDVEVKITEVEGLLESQTIPAERKESMKEVLDNQKKKLDDARKSHENGEYYTASSFCFTASIELATIEKNIGIFGASDKKEYTKSFLLETERKIIEAEKMVNATKTGADNMADIEVILLSSERINDAWSYLRDGWKKHNQERYEEALFLSSYSQERAESVMRWLELADEFGGSRIDFDFRALDSLSRARLVESLTLLNYAQVLEVSSDYMEESVSGARKNFNSGNYEYALFNTVAIKAYIEAVIEASGMVINDTAATGEKIKRLEYNAMREISHAQENGLTPIMALNYLEYGRYFEETDPVVAVNYLVYAKHFAKISTNLLETAEGRDFSREVLLIPPKAPESELEVIMLLGLIALGFCTGVAFRGIVCKKFHQEGIIPKPSVKSIKRRKKKDS